MVLTDFSGNFWNGENVENNAIGTILDEGSYEEKKNTAGDSYVIFNITVECNGKKKQYSPSRETGMALQKAFGSDSKDWIGKKIQFEHVKTASFGKTKIRLDAKPLI